MPKILALQHPAAGLAATLAAKGYETMSLQDAVRFRVHVDAVLYAAHRQETSAAFHSALEAADISVGHDHSGGSLSETLPGAIMLNITGLHPDQVVAEVEQRLQHRHWRT
jgi:hypothetical protein